MKSAILALILVFANSAGAVSLTCKSKVGGVWGYASSPSACAVSSITPEASITRDFSPLIFQDGGNIGQNRTTYMNPMYAFLKDAAAYYIKRRNPQVSQSEVDGFVLGVLAAAAQETGWTHYRLGTDHILRYMRGDNLHGHGLMQLDDRSHQQQLQSGRGVDLMYNILLGLDVYYQEWTASSHASCIRSSTDYVSRARAAWSAYNGGPGSICRFKSNGSTDHNYNLHITNKDWMSYITKPTLANPVNTVCLAEGTRPCTSHGMQILEISQPQVSCESVKLALEPISIEGAISQELAAYLREAALVDACVGSRCDFGAIDKKSSYLLKGQSVADLLNHVAEIATVQNPVITSTAIEFLSSHDGFVVEAALNVLATQKTSPDAFVALLTLFQNTSDTELLNPIMEQIERYQDQGSLVVVQDAVVNVLNHGSPLYSKELATRMHCIGAREKNWFADQVRSPLKQSEVMRILRLEQ